MRGGAWNGGCSRQVRPMAGQVIPMFSAPSPREREALDLTASYLKRAGTEAATR